MEKKSKKIWKNCIVILLIAFIVGCSHNGGEEKTDPDINYPKSRIEDGIFLIKFNNGNTFLSEDDVGEFIVNKNSRSVINEPSFDNRINNLPELEKNKIVFNDTRKINELSNKIIKELLAKSSKSNISRSVINNLTITNNDYEVGDKKNFYIKDPSNNDIQETATLKAKNDVCNIWFIDNAKNIVPESSINFDTLAQKFKSIYELNIQIMGTHKYTQKSHNYFINPCKKIDLIVQDIFYDANKEKETVTLGYFFGADLIKNETLKESDINLKSNETQCIYVDSELLLKSPDIIYSTLVHEFTHLLNHCQKTILYGKNCETWFTEMLAMLSEDMFFEKLCQESDIKEIKTNPIYLNFFDRFTYFDMYYNYGFTDIWNSEIYEQNPLIAYGNTCAYGSYLVRNKGGFELLKELATSPYVNDDAITEAVKKFPDIHPEIENFETSALYLSQPILDSYLNIRDNDIITFNGEKISYGETGLSFIPFSIEGEWTFNDGSKTSLPFLYSHNLKIPLGAYSFSIHYLAASEYSKVDFDNKGNTNLEFYKVPIVINSGE